MGTAAPVSNVVLVHGGFVDGSGWQGVYNILTRRGYHVSVVQNPTLSLAGDVTATRQVIDEQPGPVVLVGHSYGGMVITQAGTHGSRNPFLGGRMASHSVFLSQPAAVADLIEQAAAG